ncbi:hypothetical protein BDFG_05224 [Blastomyces dermatitidis ATCC 26199]|nr:hypothetical protein BDFG_05224 [Blastomyces dermatitidis ATCC 26199]
MSTSRRISEGSDGSSTDSSTDPASHDSSAHVNHDTKHQQKFSGLADQKHAAEQREEERRDESPPEDRSFVYRKPGAGNLLTEFLENDSPECRWYLFRKNQASLIANDFSFPHLSRFDI